MGIANWDSNPDNNNAAPPAGAPEGGTLVADLNNIARQIMADVRAWYELGWRDLGLALQPTGGANEIVLSGDQTALFEVNQRVQYLDGAGTQVGTITAISLATNTTLTVDTAVAHPVSQLWSGIRPSLIPAILVADLLGDVTGDVTGDLDGAHATGVIASGVLGATQATGDDSDELATTAFVQQELAAQKVTIDETTGAVPLTTSSTVTIPHQGAGTMPGLLTVTIRCTSADAGYAVGDELNIPQRNDVESANFRALNWYADATNVYLMSGLHPTYNNIMDPTDGSSIDADFSKWEAVVRALNIG